MSEFLNGIDDRSLIVGVFLVLIIISIFGVYNQAFYSANMSNNRAKTHILNTKYQLYKKKNVDVAWINRIYGLMNIIIAIITPIIMLVTSPTVGVVTYLICMIIGNFFVQSIVVKKYC